MVMLTQTSDKLIIGTNGELSTIMKTDSSLCTIKIPEPNLPPNLTKGQEESFKCSDRNVTCICCSRDGCFVAVSTQNKQVVLFDAEFKVIRNFLSNRAVSKIRFTTNNDLLLADKTGDVTLYKVQSEKSEVILGHFSMLLDVKLSDCANFVITCDRDEKIRVSRFPNAYNIESYCLGHTEFVTNVEVCRELLISAAGDGTVRFWDFLKGKQLSVIDTNEQVEDKSLVQSFCSDMDEDSVEVSALPIRDMQVWKQNDFLLIGVILMCVKGVLLYEAKYNFLEIKTRFLRRIKPDVDVVAFSLSSDFYILTENELHYIKIKDFDFEKMESLTVGGKLKLTSSKTKDVSVLYKRKFDNVQEYLERKKLRLEGKQ